MTPNFYFIFETSKSLSVRSRSLKKIYRVENFRANVLKEGLAADPIFMDVAAETLQGSDSCLLIESMESSFNLFSRGVRNKLLYELAGAAVISVRILES